MNVDWVIVGAIVFHAFKREIMTEVYRLVRLVKRRVRNRVRLAKRRIGGRWNG